MPIAAGKLRVLIATTNGPVEVLLLTEEDAAIGRCVACIGGTTETADIAGAYHAFVVRPTGVIEARFGHSCYRLDVSARIDAGSSWQLGVLAAHALLAAGRLAQENDTADAVLWATGSVRAVDLTVGAVSHVPEKLANSLDRLKQERAAGRRVLVALPAANAAEVSPTLADELAALGIETIALARVQPLFEAVAMQLPDSPGKIAVAAPVAPPPTPPPAPRVAAAPRRRWIIGAAAASVALAAAGTAAIMLQHNSESATSSEPRLASAPAPAPAPTLLDADVVPFITTQDKVRIRDEYMKAGDYKALATNFLQMTFVAGQPTQEAANRAAMAACEKLGSVLSNKLEHECDLYAAGNVVVTQRSRPPMPAQPWLVRNHAVERPFVAAQIPLLDDDMKVRASKGYPRAARSKAFVLSPNRRWAYTSGQSGPDDAIRRSLERCGYVSAAACMVVAVDDTFVVPIPTLAKVVGIYRPEALSAVRPETRDEVARRLAAAPNSWNAVAVGAGGHVGMALNADSEQSAFDGAMKDCAEHDSNCRIAVLGPFLVEKPDQGQPQLQAQNQAPNRPAEQNTAPAPQTAPPPAAPPSAAPGRNQPQARNQPQTPSRSDEPKTTPAPQAPPAPAAPPPAAVGENKNQAQNPNQTQPRNEERNAASASPAPPVPAEPQKAPGPAAPGPAAPASVALVPDLVPYLTPTDRDRIRDEYMRAPDYKALAMSLTRMAFVISGQPTQEAADQAAMEACKKLNPKDGKPEHVCDLYASGNVVVTRRDPPPMPAQPWIVRNPKIERPFATTLIPLADPKDGIGEHYPDRARPKALVLSARGYELITWSTRSFSHEAVIRRGLERCGFLTSSACMVIAIDDTFVVPIPTLAKAVGFYRPEALSGVQAPAREEVARRLASAPNNWNAVAVGAGGNAGIALRATSEQSAFDGAMKDCAQHDSNCRIAVLGPFLVAAPDHGQKPIPPAEQNATPGQNQIQAENPNQTPVRIEENTAPPPQAVPVPTAPAPPATLPPIEERHAAPSPQPAPAPASPVALVPDRVPFITTREKARIRNEYMPARDYKALATSLMRWAYVAGQPSQEAADRAAVEACKKLDTHECELYASGNIVVTKHTPPPMPPQPWLVRNPAIERPFVAKDLPLWWEDASVTERTGNAYAGKRRTKVLVLAATKRWYYTSDHTGIDEATRLGLERCGHLASSPCMVIAVDDTFVVPIPTLAKVVGLYQPAALQEVALERRDEVVRRLAAAPNSWNAVAIGTGGVVGIAVDAGSEQRAIETALADCAAHGGGSCRITVLGPFMVDATRRIEAQNQGPAQERHQEPAPAPVQAPPRFYGREEEKAPVGR